MPAAPPPASPLWRVLPWLLAALAGLGGLFLLADARRARQETEALRLRLELRELELREAQNRRAAERLILDRQIEQLGGQK